MLFYDPDRALYLYDVNSSGDTRLVFDADSGAFKSLHLPTGAASGDTLHTWLAGLHMAAPWGWPSPCSRPPASTSGGRSARARLNALVRR